MDALKKLLEQAQALQEAELARVRQLEEAKKPPQQQQQRQNKQKQKQGQKQNQGWSSDNSGQSTEWSGQGGHRPWVDPASEPLHLIRQAEAQRPVTMAERLRNPETLRTFFLLTEALGPPPGLKDEDW